MNTKTYKIVYTALLCAIICVLAPFSIPIGVIPISLATFAIYVVSTCIDIKYSSIAVLVYIALGTVGVPVFSAFSGGIAKLIGPTGGYIIGYIPLTLVCGFATKYLYANKNSSKKMLWVFPVSMIVGTVVLYLLGTIWFVVSTKSEVAYALSVCVVPFLLGDFIKIVAASIIAPQIRKIISQKVA